MELLGSERAQAILIGLGGMRHYEQLVASHHRFGRAFGFLAVVPTGDSASDTRPEFLAAKENLRVLVRKIEAFAEPTQPGSEAIAEFLLRPYLDLVAELGAEAARTKKTAGSNDNGGTAIDGGAGQPGSEGGEGDK